MARAQENRTFNEVIGLVFLGLGTLLFLALISYRSADVPEWFPLSAGTHESSSQNFIGPIGPIGAIGAGCLYFLMGAAAYLLATVMLGYGGAKFIWTNLRVARRLPWIAAFLISGACILHLQHWFLQNWSHQVNMTPGPGGWIGKALGGQVLRRLFGPVGSSILLGCIYLASLIMMTGIRPILVLRKALALPGICLEYYRAYRLSHADQQERLTLEQNRLAREARKLEKKLTKKKSAPLPDEDEPVESEFPDRPAPQVIDTSLPIPRKPEKKPLIPEQVHYEDYTLPEVDLLEPTDLDGRTAADPEELRNIQTILIDTLSQFGIAVEAGDITKGPTITRYEVYPAKGVRVDKIVSLERDLARATRAERINILAPIPGKDTVGIELANSRKVKVILRELLESDDWVQSKAKLPLALGKDVYGKTIIADLAQMPHCLVAGTTGSGKSVCINAIIASLLYRFTPEQLRFIMIDPKVVEMQIYNTLPHLVVPVITDPKKVLIALRWLIDEMDRRYKIFAKTAVRNITGFNARPKPKSQAELDAEKGPASAKPEMAPEEAEPPIEVHRDDELIIPDELPYIVVIIDELADLMQTAPADVESAIARITAMARAAGIHLIVATQTPRADVVTGVIKANIPSRIAFQVASKLDSRVILDENGADRLLGQGDMLYLPPGTSRMVRAQGVLVTDEEIRRLVDFVSGQTTQSYDLEIQGQLESTSGNLEEVSEEDEELVQKCIEIMRQEKKASTSLFQRRLRLGYTRAARVVDILEQRGYVAAGEGAKPREILKDLDGVLFH